MIIYTFQFQSHVFGDESINYLINHLYNCSYTSHICTQTYYVVWRTAHITRCFRIIIYIFKPSVLLWNILRQNMNIWYSVCNRFAHWIFSFTLMICHKYIKHINYPSAECQLMIVSFSNPSLVILCIISEIYIRGLKLSLKFFNE